MAKRVLAAKLAPDGSVEMESTDLIVEAEVWMNSGRNLPKVPDRADPAE